MTPLPRALAKAYELANASVSDRMNSSGVGRDALADALRSSLQSSPKAPGLLFWRLVDERHADTWNSGEGAFLVGGRWNRPGVRMLYGCLDPAAAILEVAVHKGFTALDIVPHLLICARVTEPAQVKVLLPLAFPNQAWLRQGSTSPNQSDFIQGEMQSNPMVVVPSAVSPHSWNLLVDVERARGKVETVSGEAFALDTRFLKR